MAGANESAAGRYNRKRWVAFLIAALLLLAVIGTALLWSAPDSNAGPGKVDLTFLSYTNTVTGSNAVLFVVSNSGPRAVTISDYFFLCPHDQMWDIGTSPRIVLSSGKAASCIKQKAKGDCTLLVLYSNYSWKEAVRHLAARAGLLRLFPRGKWGLPKNESATIKVPDRPQTTSGERSK